MKKIGVLANCGKPEAAAVLRRLERKAAELRLGLVTCGETGRLLRGARRTSVAAMARGIDVLVALGGDGTMLRAVRLLAGRDVPVLGVNLGSLGFLTSVAQEDLERALTVLARGKFSISRRAMAECRLFRGRRQVGSYRALNDVVVGWGASSRICTLGLVIDGEQVASYMCDGLVVSTPTGSTGHSLSAGGPILHPAGDSFVISVICPHTLSNRPLVVPDRSRIVVRVTRAMKKLLLSVDGQEETAIRAGDRLEVRRSPRDVRLVHLPGYSYFSLLRQKLGWRGSSV